MCTCTSDRASPCKTHSPPFDAAVRWPKPGWRFKTMPSDTFAAVCGWLSATQLICWKPLQVIAQQCHFSLSELRYEYPEEVVPEGQSPASYLAQQTWAGCQQRYPEGAPKKVRTKITEELQLISSCTTKSTSSRCSTSFASPAHNTFCAKGEAAL